uniref:Putative catalytic domain of protein tyrosine kinase n=1 Tax=Panstrongylus lignarius TaxID=156445 RepID=A0A224XG87_9HEMI
MFSLKLLLVILEVINFASGYPIDPKDVPISANSLGIAVFGVVFLFAFILAVFACACCRERRDGFKEFTNTGSLTNVGFTNALATEVSIFPPPGTGGARPDPVPVQVTGGTEQPSRPAAFSSIIPDISDWFVDPDGNFPRQQLFYQKEIGKGWFGKVVEGEARGSKVVVRILREDATNEEKAYFLHEARPYRDLVHKNVTRLFGRCLQYEPFLLLFELYTNGDLKSFLRTNDASKKTLNEQGISLKLMTDVCEGVKFMNDNGFIHTDLAARNCLVTSDLTVKIGDYGTSVDLYKNEYYIAGNVAVPIRWCAPETLHCTSTTIETKQVTAPANVWSLAVVLWEIAEFGKLPYFDLSDDQVIVRVHGDEKYRLPQPDCPYGHYLFNIMQICWRSENRASIEQVLSMLHYLKTNPFQESDFESRWKKLKPNTVPIVDNHTPIHSPRHTELAQRPYLQTKSEFDSGVDLEIKPTDDNSCKTSSPMTISPQLSVTSEDIFQSTRKKSPSLTNLQGSLEDVSSQFDSWLQGVETKTDEDRTFARSVSEAIKNLDETLAQEKTSSSSSRDSSLECQNKPLLEFNIGVGGGAVERKSESSSDTEEETWRHRIERGEFTEKVKEKSKSVTDLMVLTHIDSEESENDSLPSLTRQYSLKRNGSKGATYTSIGFGSEGNIRNAVLGEELQEKLKALTLWKTEDQSFLGKRTSDTNSKKKVDQHFLGKSISETSKETTDNVFLTNLPVEKSNPKESTAEKNASFGGTEIPEKIGKQSTEIFLEQEIIASSNNIENSFLENESSQKDLFLGVTINNNSGTDHCVRGVNLCSESVTSDNLVNVNMPSNVNIESFVNTANFDDVNKECTEEIEVNLKSQLVLTNNGVKETEIEKLINSDSSQEKDDVPKIVITESEKAPDEDDVSKESEIQFDFKPRKFVFVCKDIMEEENEIFPQASDSDCDFLSGEENLLMSNYVKSEPMVIIGSCEEHTLDYFKGLKTTFSPTDQYSDEESDVKESSSIKEDTVRQLTDTNDECVSPCRDDSTAHVTDDCISPLKDDGLKHIYDLLLEDGPIFDEVETLPSGSPTISRSRKQSECTTNSCENLNCENTVNSGSPSSRNSEPLNGFPVEKVIYSHNEAEITTSDTRDINLAYDNGYIDICDHFIKEELKFYVSCRDNLSSQEFIKESIRNQDDSGKDNLCLTDLSLNCDSSMYPSLENITLEKSSSQIVEEPLERKSDCLKSEHINKITSNDSPEINEKSVSSVNNKQLSCKNISNYQNESNKSIGSQFKSAIKVSKSKSLESVLCNKNELENMKYLSNSSISEYVPMFSLSDMMPEDLYPKQSINYDSYYSVDSGHGSDRYADQDRQIDDLKTRLEDVMKYGEDFQLQSSEDEYGGKLLTPDDERSSDSGFRDKGSLSESVEDTCDEKYNLEDIDAELEDFNALKSVEKEEVKYYEQFGGSETEPVTQVQNVEGWFLHPKIETDSDQQNGWISLSTEDEEKHTLTIDDEFVTAIRNELKEKLPCAMQNPKTEEDNSPEPEFVDPNLQFTYPAQLSPILEEQESNQSSLLVDDVSPILIIPPPEIPDESLKEEDADELLEPPVNFEKEKTITEELEDTKQLIIASDKFCLDDDVIIVDTETNEVTLIESPKPQSHISFTAPMQISENYMDDDSTGINSETYILSPDNVPLTPDMSLGSNTLSSPEHGNISGMCISPSSVRSDLFDSGPPSLPFDLGQSLEEVEEISLSKPTNEASEILQELIDAGIVRKDLTEPEETVFVGNETSVAEKSEDFEYDGKFEAIVSKELITGDLIEINTGKILSEVCNFLEEERKNGVIVKATVDSPEKVEASKSSSPEKLEEPVSDKTPVIVVEEEAAVAQDNQAANLVKEENAEAVEVIIDVKPHCTSEQSKWLQELLFTSSVKKNNQVDSIDDKLSITQNWPSNDELLSPTSANEAKPIINLRPGNITSTLALMSPDLSSTDSRSHSLLSSFASTPSDDQKQFDSEATTRATAPSSLSISTAVINVPMPSPEDADKGWRPTICQLMELTDQAEGEEMTTSFIEPDENGIYTPDWESDTSDEQSSSSGEFVWKLQEPIKMERIEEEEEDENAEDESESDDNSSEGSGTEFIPSTWNALATPSKSSIRSPDTPVKSEKKKVIFKKEKYQCIYEYPREPSDDEDSPETWQTPSVAFDFSPFTDWELGDNEMVVGPAAEGDSDSEEQRKPKKNQDYDFYRLDYNIGPHMITEDGDFFISSSSRVLDWGGAEDDGDSEFFPGRDSLLDFSPIACDLTPLNLGELRHTKDSLRLELPLLARAAAVDQANLTTDSGIDTASPKPTSSQLQQQQQQQQQQMSCAQQSAREDKGEAALLDEQPMLPSNK